MRRMILVTATALLLVGAGVAVAHGLDGKSVKQVSATFTATTANGVRTTTCTGADGSYAQSRGTYSGSATSTEPSLNGPARITAESLVNTTTGVGTVSGEVRIDTADGRHTSARFDGVLTHGSVVGLAEGGVRGRDEASLVANMSADFTAAGGFANGKFGGTAAGDAVLVMRGGCEAPKAPKPEHVKAHGAITAVSSTSISVAGVTCGVPPSLQAAVAKLKTTDVVEIECDVVSGASTLTKVSGGPGHDR
jgi:hypothetical protein